MEGRLCRSMSDKVFGGVCSGLARYFQVDIAFLRIIAVLVIVVTGVFPGLIVYVFCVLIIPCESNFYREEPNYQEDKYCDSDDGYSDKQTRPANQEKTQRIIGGGLVLIGAVILFKGAFGLPDLKYVVPVAVIVLGVSLLYKGRRHIG